MLLKNLIDSQLVNWAAQKNPVRAEAMSGGPFVAIIGGGLTGAAAAIALLRTIAAPFEILIATGQGSRPWLALR